MLGPNHLSIRTVVRSRRRIVPLTSFPPRPLNKFRSGCFAGSYKALLKFFHTPQRCPVPTYRLSTTIPRCDRVDSNIPPRGLVLRWVWVDSDGFHTHFGDSPLFWWGHVAGLVPVRWQAARQRRRRFTSSTVSIFRWSGESAMTILPGDFVLPQVSSSLRVCPLVEC